MHRQRLFSTPCAWSSIADCRALGPDFCTHCSSTGREDLATRVFSVKAAASSQKANSDWSLWKFGLWKMGQWLGQYRRVLGNFSFPRLWKRHPTLDWLLYRWLGPSVVNMFKLLDSSTLSCCISDRALVLGGNGRCLGSPVLNCTTCTYSAEHLFQTYPVILCSVLFIDLLQAWSLWFPFFTIFTKRYSSFSVLSSFVCGLCLLASDVAMFPFHQSSGLEYWPLKRCSVQIRGWTVSTSGLQILHRWHISSHDHF